MRIKITILYNNKPSIKILDKLKTKTKTKARSPYIELHYDGVHSVKLSKINFELIQRLPAL